MNVKYLKCYGKLMGFLQNYRPQRACPIGAEDFLLKITVFVVITASILFTAGSIAAAEEDHGKSHHFHKNHFALFLGTTQPADHSGIADAAFTVGIDYERRLNRRIGVGFLADVVTGGNREFLVGLPMFLHVGKRAKFQLAPGWHKVAEGQEKGLVWRTGFLWDFEVGKNTVSPSIYYDITEHDNLFVVGVGIGKGW